MTETVTLEVPADVAYIGVVRTLAAGLAARLPFTIDEIDDLRIAVDEAFALLYPLAEAGSTLRATFSVGNDVIEVAVDVTSTGGVLDRAGFGWTVLDALAHVIDVRDTAGVVGLTLHKEAEEALPAGVDPAFSDITTPAAP